MMITWYKRINIWTQVPYTMQCAAKPMRSFPYNIFFHLRLSPFPRKSTGHCVKFILELNIGIRILQNYIGGWGWERSRILLTNIWKFSDEWMIDVNSQLKISQSCFVNNNAIITSLVLTILFEIENHFKLDPFCQHSFLLILAMISTTFEVREWKSYILKYLICSCSLRSLSL